MSREEFMQYVYYNFEPFHKYWRPAIAWSYLIVCVFDFVLFPLLFGIFYSKNIEMINSWVPFTLKGGGLYHMSMLAIVGVTAWNRTQEKMQVIQAVTSPSNLSIPTPANTTPTTP